MAGMASVPTAQALSPVFSPGPRVGVASVSSRDSQGRNLISPEVRACGDGDVHRGTLNPGPLCTFPRGKPAEPVWVQEAGEHSGSGSAWGGLDTWFRSGHCPFQARDLGNGWTQPLGAVSSREVTRVSGKLKALSTQCPASSRHLIDNDCSSAIGPQVSLLGQRSCLTRCLTKAGDAEQNVRSRSLSEASLNFVPQMPHLCTLDPGSFFPQCHCDPHLPISIMCQIPGDKCLTDISLSPVTWHPRLHRIDEETEAQREK